MLRIGAIKQPYIAQIREVIYVRYLEFNTMEKKLSPLMYLQLQQISERNSKESLSEESYAHDTPIL